MSEKVYKLVLSSTHKDSLEMLEHLLGLIENKHRREDAEARLAEVEAILRGYRGDCCCKWGSADRLVYTCTIHRALAELAKERP